MNLRTEKGEIALPRDYRFDIEANHPFFSDEGSASTPTTIPGSPENRELLGFPENFNRARRFTRRIDAILSHGVFFKRCTMVLDSASKGGGITTSLALEESELYARIQDLNLKDVFEPGLLEVSSTGSAQDALTNYLTQQQNDYFILFPVAADVIDTDSADATGSKRAASVVFNAVSGGKLKISGYKVTRDDQTIAAPDYYGVMPFMKLHKMLSMMFEQRGYTVKENAFRTNATLSRIVVLHNTADAMLGRQVQTKAGGYTFTIPYPDMVPSMTIGEVIQWIRDKFGSFVTVKDREISIRLFKDIAAADYDLDLSSYMRDEATVTYPDPVMLRTGCQHDIESSEPAADTLEDLRASYSSLVDATSVGSANGTGLFHVLPLGKYYYRNVSGANLMKVGTDGMDCFRTVDGVTGTEDRISDDSFVPMIYHDGEYIPLIGDSVRRYLDVDDKDAGAEQKMMICYLRTTSRNFGTLYNYSFNGSAISSLYPPLTPEGLMEPFFGAYRDMLLGGAPVISAKFDIPLHVLASMDPWSPKLFNGAKVLIKSLKYSISNSGVSSCEATLQQLVEYADQPEIEDPQFGSNLVWEYVNTRSVFPWGNKKNGVEILSTDGLSDYKSSDKPDYVPKYPGIKAKVRKRYLKYKQYQFSSGGWFLWYWSSQSSWTATHEYEEYFISKNKE